MKVRDVMTTPVITVRPDASFARVVELLLENEISGLPVVDDEERLLGIITEADLISKEAYGFRRRRPLGMLAEYLRGHDPQWVRKGSGRVAREVMTSQVVSVTPDEQASMAARLMLESHRKRLPVIEDGRLVGIVARSDLLGLFHRTDDEILGDVEQLLADAMRVPESHDVSPSVSSGVVTLDGDALWPSDVTLIGAVVGRIAGVVAVDNRLQAREPEPTSTRSAV